MERNIAKQLSAFLLALLLVITGVPVAYAAPEEGGGDGGEQVQLTLNPKELDQLKKGDSKELKAEVNKDGKLVSDAEVTFTVKQDGTVIELQKHQNSSCTVKAVGVGNATITASYETAEASCQVKVSPAAVKKITYDPTTKERTMEVGESYSMSAVIDPSEAAENDIIWNKGDSSVVSVETSGAHNKTATITAVAPGETSVFAQVGNERSDAFKVQVSGVVLEKNTLNWTVGDSETLIPASFGNAQEVYLWSSTNISVANVTKNGKVTAYNPGKATITVSAGKYKAECQVTVEENKADTIEIGMKAGQAYSFSDLESRIVSSFREKMKTPMEYITGVSVLPAQGVLHYGYRSPDMPGSGVGGVEKYYVSKQPGQRTMDGITFVPNSSFSGVAVIEYTGYGSGKSLKGSIRVTVESDGGIACNTAEERVLHLETDDFVNHCRERLGTTLSYVTFTLPSPAKGTLYYRYSTTGQYSQKVSASSKYYVNGGLMKLEDVSFLPAKGFSGMVSVPFVATASTGESYQSSLNIQVNANNRPGETAPIEYSCANGTLAGFKVSDFNDACELATGTTLSYIVPELPNAAEGKLYYNYIEDYDQGTPVSSGQKFYRSSNPNISGLCFVPTAAFSGSSIIPFTGYGTTGESFTGEILIRVNGGGSGIHYTTAADRPVKFEKEDFRDLCREQTGREMDNIYFELPSAWQGTLYLNYRNSNSSKVSANSSYSPYRIDEISFVPDAGFSGTVVIPFHEGGSKHSRFYGEVIIDVDSESFGDEIAYTTMGGGVVRFDAGDFERACRALTGDRLNYVNFTLPAQQQGKLYYRYDEDRGSGSSVSSGTNYYRAGGSRQLENVSFVADKAFSGTVELPYTGRSMGGDSFSGIVTITVAERRVRSLSYNTASVPVRFSGGAFRAACEAMLPDRLSQIKFDYMPSSYYGKLVENYTRPNTGTAASENTFYSVEESLPLIDDLTFIPKAGYQGRVELQYTAMDRRGNTVSGTVQINVDNQYLETEFRDLGNYAWAAPSIEFLHQGGVVNGYSDTTFGPSGNTSRGAFVLMLCRLFHFQPQNGQGFRDVPVDSAYYAATVTARELGIISGDVNGRFHPKDPVTRQQAVVMLVRAMEAAGWTINYGSPQLLTGYNDGAKVSDYAKSAMSTMIHMGVLKGDKKNNLNPHKPISRAEMAVILHRTLTY